MLSWKHAHLWLNGRAKLQFWRMFAKPVKFLFFLRAYTIQINSFHTKSMF